MLPSRVVYPNPSGSLAAVAYREQVAYGYAGITSASFTGTLDTRYPTGLDTYNRTASGLDTYNRTAAGNDEYNQSISGRGPN